MLDQALFRFGLCASLLLLASPVSAQTWQAGFDAALGSLPSAQGAHYFWADPSPVDGLNETADFLVALGTLYQAETGGPNADPQNLEGYRFDLGEFDFDDGLVFVDFRLKIITSGIDPLGTTTAGYSVALFDSDGEIVTLYISALRLVLDSRLGIQAAVNEAFDTRLDFVDYQIRVDPLGAHLIVNGLDLGRIDREEFRTGGSGGAQLQFGDRSSLASSSSELQSLRITHRPLPPSEVRNYEVVTQHFESLSAQGVGATVSCPAGSFALGGGVTPIGAEGLVAMSVSQATGGTPATGWRGEAVELVPTSVNWGLRIDAICGEVPSPEPDWRGGNNPSDFDGVDRKEVSVSCPTGMAAISGGAGILEDGSQGDAAVLSSRPQYLIFGAPPTGWIAEGQSTANLWYIDVQVDCAPIADPTVAKTGLVGRWQGVHAGGDSWGFGDGTLENGTGLTAGLTGTAFSFDGVSGQSVNVPSEDFLEPGYDLYPQKDFSVDAWVQASPLQPSGFKSFVSLYDFGGPLEGGESQSSWKMGMDADGYAWGYMRDANGPFPNSFHEAVGPSLIPVDDGAPHHVLMQRDNDDRVLRLYVDGSLQSVHQYELRSDDGLESGASPRPALIGARQAANSTEIVEQFAGLIDDVKYWSRAIRQEEIRNIAGCGVPILPRILNLDATVFAGPADKPHKLCVYLEAGVYQLTLLAPTVNSEAHFTAWSAGPSLPWGTVYSVSPDQQGGFTAGLPGEANSAQEAFDASSKTVFFELFSDQRVHFSIIEDRVLDNRGGVSLRLEEYVPEPTMTAMLLSGLAFLSSGARRRRRGAGKR